MRSTVGVVIGIGLCAGILEAQVWMLRGKVVMEDGSPPLKTVLIERYCGGNNVIREAITDRNGRFLMRRMMSDPAGLPISLSEYAGTSISSTAPCVLRASLAGYQSNTIDLNTLNAAFDPILPPLVLHRALRETTFNLDIAHRVSKSARKAWERGLKAAQAKNWAQAEQQLRAAVAAQPKFPQAWHLLAIVCQNQKKVTEAREAYQRAIETDPELLSPYLLLVRLSIDVRDWETARNVSDALIRRDTRHRYPEAYVHNAMARYRLRDFDGAETSAREAVRLDKKHQTPRADYVLGVVLAAKRDYTGAAEHMRRYLELEPRAADAAAVRTRISKLGTPEGDEPAPETAVLGGELPAAGEAWVPGGMKALAFAAGLKTVPPVENFFAEYCQAVIRHATPDYSQGIPGFLDRLRAYFTAVAELAQAGERRGDRTAYTLSLASPARRDQAGHILGMLGWKLAVDNGDVRVEPGVGASDGLRQSVTTALGIDEVEMQRALEAGRDYTFEIIWESARVIGGDAWTALVKTRQDLPGGLAEAFAADLRLARVYAAVSAMGIDTAASLVSGTDLRTLVERFADPLYRHAEAFRIENGGAVAPGGTPAVTVWTKLAGVGPRVAPAFFRAILEKDQGRLGTFFFAVSEAGEARQQYFARTAPAYYHWFRPQRPADPWPADFLRNLPLDSSGKLRFPGGRRAWTTSATGTEESALFSVRSLEAFAAIALLEEKRQLPLDEVSARLLATHYTEWRRLFPYFQILKGLGQPEFEALEVLSAEARALDPPGRNLLLGQWHSLVELIALGEQAGALDPPVAARAFRVATRARSPNPDFGCPPPGSRSRRIP